MTFTLKLISKGTDVLGDSLLEVLTKWGLVPSLVLLKFSFEEPLKDYLHNALIVDLFNEHDVVEATSGNKVESVDSKKLACEVVDLSFFDRLRGSNIVRRNGSIMRCFEENVNGIHIANELQKWAACCDEETNLFTEKERKELLFMIFRQLVLGGALNQYDDSLEPYLGAAKEIYKILVRVHKKDGVVVPSSFAYSIMEHEDERSFSFVTMDPYTCTCTLMHHKCSTIW